MSSAKVRKAAKRWNANWDKSVDMLTPEQINFRIELAYTAGHAAGRTYQREFSKKQSSRGNIPASHDDE